MGVPRRFKENRVRHGIRWGGIGGVPRRFWRRKAGLARAKAQGKRLGRPERLPDERLAAVRGLSVREAARSLGISAATAHRWLSQKTP